MARDLRYYARQTNVRLGVGAILILFIIGDGLIYLIYGRNAAILGFICLAMGLAPLILIGLALWAMDWIVKRANRL
jgi:hypothetical protein